MKRSARPCPPPGSRGRRERVSLSALSLFLLTTGLVWAEAVGSPAGILKKGRWVMGLGGGGLFGRDMKGDAKVTLSQGGHFRGYGLTDWLSIYGKLGLAFLEVDDASILKTLDPGTTNRFGLNVLSSVQLKARLWQNATQDLEWDGSVRYVDIRARHKGKNELRWHEWQLATSVAKGFGRFTPYAGVSYSIVDITYRVRENGKLLKQGTYDQDQPLDIFLGMDYAFGASEDVFVNVEVSFLNGGEVTAAVQYLF